MINITDKKINDLLNYTRLNVKSLKDIHPMYQEVYYELFGLIVNIPYLENFNQNIEFISNYHHCPINGVTNWGNRYKDKPNGYPGWDIMNKKGTIRNKYNEEPTKEDLNKINKELIIKLFPLYKEFRTIKSLDIQNGISTGSFNGGYNFMGCFHIFIYDFPNLLINLKDFYNIKTINSAFKNLDYDSLVRNIKIKRLKSKLKIQ